MRITSGEFAAGNHAWSNDGSRIYFVTDRRRDAYYLTRDSDLYAVPRDGGDPTAIASIDGSIGASAESSAGRLAF